MGYGLGFGHIFAHFKQGGLRGGDARHALDRYAFGGRVWRDKGIAPKIRACIIPVSTTLLLSAVYLSYAKRHTPKKEFWSSHTFKCNTNAAKPLPKSLLDDKLGVENAAVWREKIKHAAQQFTGCELHIENLQTALADLEKRVANGDKRSCCTLRSSLEKYDALQFLEESDIKWPGTETHDQLSNRLYTSLLTKLESSGLLTLRDCKKVLDDVRFPFMDNVSVYGKDVAHLVPTIYEHEGDVEVSTNTLDVDSQNRLVEALDRDGAVVLRNYSIEKKLDEVRKEFKIKRNWVSGGNSFRTSGLSSEVLEELDSSEMMAVQQPTLGRRHHLLRDTSLKSTVEQLQKGVLPIVQRYMHKLRKDSIIHSGDAVDKDGKQVRLYLSEAQLIVTDPLATTQFWHANNTRSGITVMVPLVDIGVDLGTDSFFPGSHKAVGRSLGVLKNLGYAFHQAIAYRGPVNAPLGVNDILITDARLVKRGLPNTSFQSAGVFVVFR